MFEILTRKVNKLIKTINAYNLHKLMLLITKRNAISY